jgi:hypothetical protein
MIRLARSQALELPREDVHAVSDAKLAAKPGTRSVG